MRKPPDWRKYPIRTCRTLHYCELCGGDIRLGETYYDGGYARRIHTKCANALPSGSTE